MRRRELLAGFAALTAAPALGHAAGMPKPPTPEKRARVAASVDELLAHLEEDARSRSPAPPFPPLTAEQRARYDAMIARMNELFRYEVVTVPGSNALSEWQRLRGLGMPVVIGDDEQLDRLRQQFSIDDPIAGNPASPGTREPAEILADAAKLAYPGCLTWSGGYASEDLRAPVGDWPAQVEANDDGLTVATDILSRKVLDRVHILLLPAKASWEVPAWLRWGNWNACPPPENHVAAMRHWHERYGAELVGIDGDTLNLRVSRRPQTREEALALARDQYRYCPDIVDQGVRTLSALAATLMASDWWFFWWD